MSSGATRHPSDQTLAEYRLGTLDAMFRDSVAEHLVGCDECRRRAEVEGGPARGATPSAAFASSLADGDVQAQTPSAGSMPRELAEHPDYEVIRELGRGGMGVVYLAENRLMGRKEVLKVVGSHLVQKKNVLDRFLREIRAAAQLRHPNIVAALAASRLGETIVFSMEYVEGYDLAKLVERKGTLDVAVACNFIHQAAQGLQHAHERGMVHRDIKPSNLMVARDGKRPVLKILDFGLAKVTSEAGVDGGLTHEGQMLGTPHYVAPEQTTDAQKADIRADIYSLGCTLYCILSGRPPFDAGSLFELLQAHHSKEPKPLSEIRGDVPPELADVVAKMMAKAPDARYQNPGEVAAALAPFFRSAAKPAPAAAAVGTGTILDVPPPSPASSTSPVASGQGAGSRPRRGLIAAAVAASVLVVASAVAWLATRPAPTANVAASSSQAPAAAGRPRPSPAPPAPDVPVAETPKPVPAVEDDEDADGPRRAGVGPFAKKKGGDRPGNAPADPEPRGPAGLAADPESETLAFKTEPAPGPAAPVPTPIADVAARSLGESPRPAPTQALDEPVEWKELLQSMDRYDGREVQVREVLAYTQTPFIPSSKIRGGYGARLKIKNGPAVSTGDGQVVGSAARLSIDPAMVQNFFHVVGLAKNKPSPEDPFEVVARLRVDARENLLTLVAMEVLFAYNRLAVARGELGEAFKVFVVDERTATVRNGDGLKWIERMGGSKFLDRIKREVRDHMKNRAADQRWAESNALFNQVAEQSARWAEQDRREQDAIRRRMMNTR